MFRLPRTLGGKAAVSSLRPVLRSSSASVPLSVIRKRALRKRGVGVNEAMFGILIFGVFAAVIAQMGWEEQQKITDRSTSFQFVTISNAAKSYVAAENKRIRADFLADLADGTVSPAQALHRSIGVSDLITAGYLPGAVASMGDASTNYYGQSYEIWIRGVLRSDTAWPQDTVTKSSLGPLNLSDMNGSPMLTNGIFDLSEGDDELDLEAVLITVGGDEIPLDRGGRVVEYAQSPTIGMIYDEGGGAIKASGVRGNFSMPGDPWTDLGAVLEQGRLLGLLWISEANLASLAEASSIKGALRRCDDILDDTERDACLNDGNKMWSDIVMTQRPAAMTVAEAPGLYGLKNLGCRDRSQSGFITGPAGSQTIHDDPSATDPSAPGYESTSILLIDCDTTRVSGDVAVSGDVTAEVVNATSDLQIAGDSIGDKLIIASGTVLNGETSPAPVNQCPIPVGGTDPLPYKIDFWVAGMVETIGRPIAGFRTYEDLSAAAPANRDFVDPVTGTFRTSVMAFVGDDNCVNVSGGVITPIHDADTGDFSLYGTAPNQQYVHNDCRPGSGSPFAGTDVGGFVTGDGYPDIYRLLDGQARIGYQISCVPVP